MRDAMNDLRLKEWCVSMLHSSVLDADCERLPRVRRASALKLTCPLLLRSRLEVRLMSTIAR